jgi:hypothetical protein
MGEKNPSGEYCLRKFHSERIPASVVAMAFSFAECVLARRYFCGLPLCVPARAFGRRKYFVKIEEAASRVNGIDDCTDDCGPLNLYLPRTSILMCSHVDKREFS